VELFGAMFLSIYVLRENLGQRKLFLEGRAKEECLEEAEDRSECCEEGGDDSEVLITENNVFESLRTKKGEGELRSKKDVLGGAQKKMQVRLDQKRMFCGGDFNKVYTPQCPPWCLRWWSPRRSFDPFTQTKCFDTNRTSRPFI